MNAIDRLVGWINPGAGLRRVALRQALTRAYEAAAPKDTWRPRRAGASADADHRADAATLRAKARSLYQNVPYIRAGIEGLVSYTIGTGITSRAINTRDAEAFNAAWLAWQAVCDADGRLSWSGMQAAAHRAMEVDGEVLIRIRPRRPTDGLPIPLQLQLLEIDYLDTSKTGVIGGNEIVNGIEHDPLGRVVAYWLWDRHPGGVVIPRGAMRESTRVPAERIIHLFNPERPGQGRGFTRLAPIIPRVRDLQLYEDAELARKNLETRLSVLASGDVSQLADAEPGQQLPSGDLGDLAGGSIIQIPAGMSTTVIEPKAAPGYVDYLSYQHHVIAAGMGVPYEILTGDVSKTNFSSARVRRLDFRTAVQASQWNVIIPRLIEPVCRAAAQAAALAGIIRTPALQWDHSTPKWDYVNPEQDVRSDMLEISAGLSSLSEKLRQRGYNPAQVFAEIQSDLTALESVGTLPMLLALQGKVMPGAAMAQQAASARDVADIMSRAAPPVVNVGAPVVNVPPQEIRVDVAPAAVTVEAPSVNVEAPAVRVDVSPTPVHVDAPTVHVTNASPEVRVDVAAPVVHVDAPVIPAPVVNVSTPARRTESQVTERDSLGRIVRTLQTEVDIPPRE